YHRREHHLLAQPKEPRQTDHTGMKQRTKTTSYEPFAVDKMFGSIIAADADKNHSVSEEEFVRHYVESQA
ncbi:hypothetical protein, partial [Streptomyces sp. NPDC090131]|uniref:hypothetical protein n=1 Tax=Streptomyces sp. NPDC090131 TaxID=3365954 RepID=UPI0037FAE3B4